MILIIRYCVNKYHYLHLTISWKILQIKILKKYTFLWKTAMFFGFLNLNKYLSYESFEVNLIYSFLFDFPHGTQFSVYML